MSSVEVQNRSFAERLRLNHQLLKNKYWMLPVDPDDKKHMNFSPIGRGQPSSSLCSKWVDVSTCKNIKKHKDVFVDGQDYTGKIAVRNNHLWCNSRTCPICFIRGYSTRRARTMVGRLDEGVKRGFGEVEHVVVSPPVCDRDLPEPIQRQRCADALADRGCTGWGMVFHGYRPNGDDSVLGWSSHYHAFAFVEGGFDRCRKCVHDRGDCEKCATGFKGREVRGFKKDGYLVSVKGKRRTVFGTAFYQFHHCTIRLGVKRFCVLTWWGNISTRKFASVKVQADSPCQACGDEMVKSVHFGGRKIVKDIGSPDYVPFFPDDEFDVSGQPNYVDRVGGGFG